MIHKTFPGSPVRHHNLKRSHPWGKWTWPWIISNLLPIWHRHGMYIYWGRLFPDVAENKVTANYPEHAVTFSASCLSLKRPVWIKGKWWIIQYNRDSDRKERESGQKNWDCDFDRLGKEGWLCTWLDTWTKVANLCSRKSSA